MTVKVGYAEVVDLEMEGPGGFYVGVRVWLWFYERRAKVPLVGRADVPKSAVEKW